MYTLCTRICIICMCFILFSNSLILQGIFNKHQSSYKSLKSLVLELVYTHGRDTKYFILLKVDVPWVKSIQSEIKYP